MATDHEYDELRLVLQERLGARPAGTLMAMLPPSGEEPLRRRDLDLLGRELRTEMADLGIALRGEMAELRGEIAILRTEVVELRADYAAQLPKLIAANIASMIGVAGLVLAAGAVL
jgi:hypothetical protein